MLRLYVKFREALRNEEGQDLVEYALLGALIAVAAVTIMGTVGTKINGVFTTISGDLP